MNFKPQREMKTYNIFSFEATLNVKHPSRRHQIVLALNIQLNVNALYLVEYFSEPAYTKTIKYSNETKKST